MLLQHVASLHSGPSAHGRILIILRCLMADGHGWPWMAMDGHDGHGWPWMAMDGHGWPWMAMGGYGWLEFAEELLQKMGPAWLTKAFHTAGAFASQY